MGFKFWKWIYDYSRKQLIDNYAARKCEHCGRWDCEAPIVFVSENAMYQRTRCTGCKKITRWWMGGMTPLWASRFKESK